ncbi:MAG TPA: PD-(D/E)XK nuclease family protein [Gammaproteobacteria bacterium]|nr:PD-(D/E)XK nuclease family protein [Gammaproteobacteria bacterium]
MNLFDLVTSGTLLLTPNRRLAASVSDRFHQLQIKQQKKCWASLDILPLTGWLQRLWHEWTAKEVTPQPLLLTKNQKAILWETILRESPLSDALLQVSETAKLAESAHELLHLWEVSQDDPMLSSTEDSEAYTEWAREFQSSCKKNNWIIQENLANILKKNILAGNIMSPQRIILVGFTELSPQHTSLINAFQQSGSEIIHYHSDTLATSIRQIALSDEETEIRTMARFAKSLYEKAPEKKPSMIGCLVPSLETLRDRVLKIFLDVFAEDNTFSLDHTASPFNLSAGKNLLSFPIIRTAIQLLKLADNTLPLETFISLLRSPFTGDAEKEKCRRANFENHLKKANVTSVSMTHLLNSNNDNTFLTRCPALAKRFRKYIDYFSTRQKKYSLHEWARYFIDSLTLLGWPGERSLNSEEYQVTQRFLDLLKEYGSLDSVLKPQRFSEAIHWLIKLTTQTVFQAQSPEAPIQILGLLEAAEHPFEHLWVMGMDDTRWPASPKPNPLIPQRLQKMLDMPHATTERELAWSESLLTQLKHSATTILFSHSKAHGDIPLRPSALLHSIESITPSELTLSDFTTPAEKIFAARRMEDFIDEVAPPVQENENIQGGTALFKQQAICPFKAFAEIRLHARAIDTPTMGLRPKDRGNIVHHAMERVWNSLKDSRTLTTLPEQELKNLITECARQAVQKTITSSALDKSNNRYLELELQRLEGIMLQWLIEEKKRPAFKVAFQEQEIQTTVGQISVTLRMDRIDELADGSQLIIDYKTGKNNDIKKWFGKRPDEPQLPLYCLSGGEAIAGISFAALHPEKVTFEGVSQKNLDIPSIRTLPEIKYADATLWEQQLAEWKTVMENLGNDFLQGIAHVDPKDPQTVCDHCQLHSFCRIHEK